MHSIDEIEIGHLHDPNFTHTGLPFARALACAHDDRDRIRIVTVVIDAFLFAQSRGCSPPIESALVDRDQAYFTYDDPDPDALIASERRAAFEICSEALGVMSAPHQILCECTAVDPRWRPRLAVVRDALAAVLDRGDVQ